MPFTGNPLDRESRVSRWLREAVEFDLIDVKTLPHAWLKRWR